MVLIKLCICLKEHLSVSFLNAPSAGIETIKLPSKMRKRGRPKGADKIIIGSVIFIQMC